MGKTHYDIARSAVGMGVPMGMGMGWVKVKVKFFPYSLPSVGPGADPGVQAVSPQVT